jgi:titin
MSKHWFARWNNFPKSQAAGSRRRAALRRRLSIEFLEGRQLLSTFAVSSAGDSGSGTLRQAIINSDNTPATASSPNLITFNSLSNLVQIELQAPLPALTEPVVIDGTTALSYNGNHPFVQLIGNYAGGSALGLDITASASGTEVKALAIDGFNAGGVLIDNASNVTLDHDYFGLDPNNNALGTDVNLNDIYEGNGVYGVTIQSENLGTATGNVLSNDIVSATSYNGIILSGTGTTKNVVESTIIGSDNTGASVVDDSNDPLGNGQHGGGGSGVVINQGASFNTLGGTTAGAGDVILGNHDYGVYITDAGTNNNAVDGDVIGTDITGMHAVDGADRSYGNGASGVAIVLGAENNVVSGSSAAPEVISNNGGDGVLISGSMTSDNKVFGVHIGTDITGEAALPNAGDGVSVSSAASDNFVGVAKTAVNIISGNTGNGVSLSGFDTDSNLVENNLIGIDAGGTTALGNGADGVLVSGQASNNFIGYASAGDNNVISGNKTWGVYITDSSTDGNTVANDFIGTNVAGTFPVPNNNNGVDIVFGAQNNTIGGTTTAARNLISGNLHEGVLIGFAGTSGNVVEGNFIGTDHTGKALLPSQQQTDGVYIGLGAGSNTIGGQNPTGAFNTAAWNVVSGNSDSGILVTDSGTTGTVICGNFIGTDATGTLTVPNGTNGITIAAGTSSTTVGAETSGIANLNVISGNLGDGISIFSSGNNISFNYIGVDLNNQIALPNLGNGVSIHLASANRVNLDVIRNNGGYGILTNTGASDNAWYYDSIYANVAGGIAQPTNPTPQPAPVLTGATVAGGQTTISGTITGSPFKSTSGLVLQFYASPAPTTAASIQGLTFVGQSTVSTDANGDASFSATIAKVVAPGEIFTATLDYSVSSTSVFSNAVAAPKLAPPTLAPIASQTVVTGQKLTVALQGTDPNGLPLTYSATAETQLYYLKSTYGFYQFDGSYFTNHRGQQEEYLRAKVSYDRYNTGGVDPWYYVLPNGDLYEFAPPYNNQTLTGVLVAHLGTAVYNNPALLWNASSVAPPVTLAVSGNQLTITPSSSFVGVFYVIATDTDGHASASQTFQVTVTS